MAKEGAMTSAEAVNNARELLEMARTGLADIESGDPRRRRPGMRNIVVFGRAVTQAIQRLRTVIPAFDEWWLPRIEKLGSDPLFVYFNTLRNTILKEGELPATNVLHVAHLDGDDMARLMANPPPGAKSFVMGDRLGGNGWRVEMPDGTEETLYVNMPSDIAVKSWLELEDAPTEHDGSPIPDASFETLGRLYVEALDRLLADAESRFG
jgi:hypothetical protein